MDQGNKVCEKCGAHWVGGQLYWATGAKGKEEDLAGLVCNSYGNENCLNPKRGDETGDTWEKRLALLDKFTAEVDRQLSD